MPAGRNFLASSSVSYRSAAVSEPRGRKGLRMITMRRRRSTVLVAGVVSAALSLSARVASQQPSPQSSLPDVQKLGPQVGSPVPDFTLLDQKGQSRTLASVMGPKGLMLVFNRSADW